MNINTLTLSGTLTDDPEVRTTRNDKELVSGKVCVDMGYQGRDGWVEGALLYLEYTAFGHAANSLKLHAAKGDRVMFVGQLSYREFETQYKDKETGRPRMGKSYGMTVQSWSKLARETANDAEQGEYRGAVKTTGGRANVPLSRSARDAEEAGETEVPF